MLTLSSMFKNKQKKKTFNISFPGFTKLKQSGLFKVRGTAVRFVKAKGDVNSAQL